MILLAAFTSIHNMDCQELAHLQLLNQVPVSSIGFTPANPHYFASRVSTSTVDFVDESHLLFTFRHSQLLERHEPAGSNAEEEAVRGVVMNLATNAISAPVEWRMADHGLYLMPLPGGRFLLRDETSLRLLAGDLTSRPVFPLSNEVVFLTHSPDGKRVELQTRRAPDTVALQIVDTAAGKVLQHAEIKAPADLPISNDGILTAKESTTGHWALADQPFAGTSRHIADVTSACQPSLEVVGPDQVLVATCRSGETGRDLQLFNLEGARLWSSAWGAGDEWPTLLFSPGSPYLVLSVIHPKACSDCDEDRPSTGSQELKIFRLGSKTTVAQATISPPLSDERNFALSPSGHKLAVLEEKTIRVYRLP